MHCLDARTGAAPTTPGVRSPWPFARATTPTPCCSRNAVSRSSPTRIREEVGSTSGWASTGAGPPILSRTTRAVARSSGCGVAAAAAPRAHVRREARRLFKEAAAFRSMYPRATAPAVIGAAELLRAEPENTEARSIIDDALDHLPRLSDDARWAWPEARLGYANAILPEALIAAGAAIDDKARGGRRSSVARLARPGGAPGRPLQRHAGRRPGPR